MEAMNRRVSWGHSVGRRSGEGLARGAWQQAAGFRSSHAMFSPLFAPKSSK